MRSSVLLLCLGCGSSAAPVHPIPSGPRTSDEVLPPHHYRLELEEETAALTLWLPSSEQPIEVDLPDLAGREDRRTQIEDVRCDGASVQGRAGWRLPMGCRVLRWRVRFRDVPGEGVDPAAQPAVRDPQRRWWFLTGAAALIRPRGSTSAGTIDIRVPPNVPMFHRLPRAERLGHALPPAPGRVLLGFGGFFERETSDGATIYRHLFDREPSAEPSTYAAEHAQAAAYLVRVTGARPSRAIDVFWFGREAAARSVSGAAGIDAIAASFLVGEIPADAPAHARYASLLVLLHEQVHLLAGSRMPAWASESIAHYYALKSLVHAGPMTGEEMDAFIRQAAAAGGTGTLLEAQATHGSGGAAAAAAYTRFYTRGALLWLELDRAIQEASDGARSLDDVMPEVLGLVFVDRGAPPQRFLEILTAAGLPDPAAIVRPHLGWPEPPSP